MKGLSAAVLSLFLVGQVASLQSSSVPKTANRVAVETSSTSATTRQDFLQQSAALTIASVATAFSAVEPAVARGRATLDQAYERYTPRIIAGGSFYKKDLRDMIAKSDFDGV